ncbi:MAG: hypothetical protein LBC61_06375 [Candidatus Peribacteria bacterium]|nr:hypothetical protein [Candidatus Peribacteria bacterium]
MIFSVDTNFSSNTQVYANNTDQYRIDVRVSPDSSVNGMPILGFQNYSFNW